LGAFGSVTTFWTEPEKTRTLHDGFGRYFAKDVPEINFTIKAVRVFWFYAGFWPLSVSLNAMDGLCHFGVNYTEAGDVCLSDRGINYFYFYRKNLDRYLINHFWTTHFCFGTRPTNLTQQELDSATILTSLNQKCVEKLVFVLFSIILTIVLAIKYWLS